MRTCIKAVVIAFVVAGCTTIPSEAFKSYTDAYDDVKAESEAFLVELDAAFKLDAANTAKREAKDANTNVPPFPMNASGSNSASPGQDDILARRRALELIQRFNTTLSELAVGRSPEEVRASANALISGLNQFAEVVELGAGATIPFGEEVAALIGTVVQKLEEAHNRAQFVAAMRAGAPVISRALRQLQADANHVYRIRALDARSRALAVRIAMSNKVQEMTGVAATVHPPTDQVDIAALEDVQDRLTHLVRAPGLQEPDALRTSGSDAFSKLVITQLQQTMTQLEASGKAYQAIVDEQNAFYGWIESYKAMVGKADATIKAVVAALDRPVDLPAAASDLVAFAFQVKRDFEALRAARAAAAGA